MSNWNKIFKKYLSGEWKKPFLPVLSMPNTLLLKIGVLKSSIEIGKKVLDEKFKSHKDLKYEYLSDLDKGIQRPLLAFKYEGRGKYNRVEGINIILNTNVKDKYLLLGIHFKQNKKSVINSIRTIHLRPYTQLINWINKDLLLYADIKKLREIAEQTPQSAEMVNNILSAISKKHPFNTRKNKLFISSFNGSLQGITPGAMLPTYKLLPDYSHLIDGYEGTRTYIKKGNVHDVVDEIEKIIRNNYRQVSRLAQYLQAGTPEQTAYNIWHWCITNIKYKLDRLGTEELRTPARSWADRQHGIDCDDFTIMVASLLLNLGYSPQLVIVAFNGSSQYSHIFAATGTQLSDNKPVGGIIIDPVDKKFNRILPNITKTKIRVMNRIEVLNGIAETPKIAGLGFFQDYTEKEQQLINSPAVKSEKERKKIQFLLAHKNTLIEEPLKLIIPYIQDILSDGTVIWKNEQIGRYGEQFMDEVDTLTADMLSGRDPEFSEEEVLSLTGLGELYGLGRRGWFKKALSKFKKKVSKAWNKVKTGIKKAANAVKNTATKAWKGFKKFSLAGPRNAFLLLVRINAFGLATKFSLGYLPYSELKKYGITYTDYKNLVSVTQKVERFFVKAGGNAASFKKAVMKGKKHRPKLNKKMATLWKSGLRGLGATSVAATAASATPFLTKVAQWFKKINFKKILSGLKLAKAFIPKNKKSQSTTALPDNANDAQNYEMPTEDTLPNTRTISPLNNEQNNTDKQKSSTNWLLPAGIAASVLLMMM